MFFSLIIIFFAGLCAGSFLNVLIYRLPREGESVVSGRSRCPYCKKKLSWWELVPVLSFIFLKGRCAGCGEKISWQYPLVELATGFSFSLVLWKFASIYGPVTHSPLWILNLLFWLFVVSVLVVVFMIDLEHYIVPNSLVYFGSIASLFFLTARSFFSLETGSWFSFKNLPFLPTDLLGMERILGFQFLDSVLAEHLFFAIMGVVFFLLLVLLTKGKGMGMGDVKLVFFLGLLLGVNLIDVLFLSFWLGALVGVVLIFTGKKGLKSKVPFAPFLVASSFLFVVF